MTDKKIGQLTERLRRLNLEQERIILEIDTLNKRSKDAQETNKTVDAVGIELLVGDEVRIINKGKFIERRGTVARIGKLVTIQLRTGQTTVRKASNLRRQDAGRDTNTK